MTCLKREGFFSKERKKKSFHKGDRVMWTFQNAYAQISKKNKRLV